MPVAWGSAHWCLNFGVFSCVPQLIYAAFADGLLLGSFFKRCSGWMFIVVWEIWWWWKVTLNTGSWRILKHKGEKGFGLDEKECDTWASSCDFCQQTSDWWGFQYRDWLLSCLPRKIYHYKWILYKNRKISNFIFNKHLQLWCICSSHTDVMWALSASERISSSWWKLMKWNETVYSLKNFQ